MKKRVFSGIQATGNIHIGNYMGAIRHWVASQDEYDNIFCIVDLHSITVPQNPEVLKDKIREVAGLLFAAGINPGKSALFVQSHVSAHAELAWILNCFTPLGWLQRMTQFKEKSHSQRDLVSVGLFDYPVLQAADILLYDTDYVPVGEDQRQHVELTRDIAKRFNSIYGETLRLPEALIPEVGARVMGLDDPTKKMSKSAVSKEHAISLLDTPEEIRAKFMKATTDSLREIRFDQNRPGVYNLLSIYELFSGLDRAEIESHFDGKGYGDLKKSLAEVVSAALKPLQQEYRKLMNDKGQIDSLLAEGANSVQSAADKTLAMVKERIGLG